MLLLISLVTFLFYFKQIWRKHGKNTEDPKRQEQDKTTYMESSKEDVLRKNQLLTFSFTVNSTISTDSCSPFISCSTSNFAVILISSDTYIYGVSSAAFLSIGTCLFFTCNKKSSQVANKEQVNEEQQQPIKPTKQCNMLQNIKNET